ncbi:4-hydroxy-tetrahydrodipicolinate synthase [Reichenbachiella agarivorans]|uniref:4-hydroxy-tetrahydrodipicolinate synthase n=1 Tax=Reichenbachiella agarivorans TaxID=2979464 RepID=A0ABY6CN19_9BACT|nr:4-hydroxy-tetrahydrodipicolinate synthase [Reichenbachiella agarivorans]UXP31907.1 4-hydroxy-tetrahydrodipicolinate synthase [Reichenbachiella agarivorans]
MNNKFKGTGVALVTPFSKDSSVDFDALAALVKHVTDGGVDYLVVMGTTAESPTLSGAEKIEVLRFVKSVNNKNLPIVYGLGGNDTRAMVEKFKKFEVEVDAFLVVCPYYNRPNQMGLKAHYKAIADAAKKPIILYNVPKRTGVNLEAKTVLELAKHPNIIGIKEANGNHVDQCREIALSMPDDFLLTSGDDDLIIPFIQAGGHGVISVIANALPKHTVQIVNQALAGDMDTAVAHNKEIEELLSLIFVEGNPTGVKALLNSKGLGENVLRLPLVAASKELYAKIEAAAKKLS